MTVFASFGINWELIFGDEIAGLAELSAVAIARICTAALLWLWLCAAMFVQSLVEAADAGQASDDGGVVQTAYVWAQVASATIVGAPLLLLLLPVPVLRWRSRLSCIVLVCKMAIVPFMEVDLLIFSVNICPVFPMCMTPSQQVSWAMFFVGDQLCSHSRAIADMMTVACLTVSDAAPASQLDSSPCLHRDHQQRLITIAVLLPLASRALQCFRRFVDVRIVQGISGHLSRNHALNCLKYCLGIVVAITHNAVLDVDSGNSAAAAWLALACVSIAYAFWWDITRDWGLAGNLCDLAHAGLRQDLLLLPHWARRGALYYLAVGFNLVARCCVLVAAVAAPVEWRDVMMLALGLIEVT